MTRLLLSTFLIVWTIPAMAEDNKPWWQLWSNETASVDTVSTQAVENTVASVTSKAPLFNKQEKQILNDYLLDRVLPNRHQNESDYDDDNHKGNKHKDKAKKQKQLPPGLQKKLARGGELPPGWQKKVARGEVLDSDVYAQSTRLPRDIIDILPTNPDGTSIVQIDDRIVRVMDATNVIIDVLGGVSN